MRLQLALIAALAGCGGDGDREAPREPTPTRGVQTLVEGLDVPWEITFLPDGRAFITQRGGAVRLLEADGRLREEPIATVPRVVETGEAGLLGIALDPEFADNRLVYVYRTTEQGNEVVRLRFTGERLVEEAVLVSGIAAAAIHDGGRLRFGPDGDLYFTTGDAAQPELAQDPDSLNGKILRIDDRRAREGAGVRPEVVSIGHRNPQGLAWDAGGRLIAPEHGPDGDDEVNIVERGANYGWPEVRGEEHGSFRAPVVVYEDTIAPSGAAFLDGHLYVAALRGEQLRRLRIDDSGRATRDEALLEGRYGRLRSVVAHEGALYVLTNNTDGRGDPGPDDDRLLRLAPPP